jgi:hypothetical protein
MVQSADEPESIHREPPEREDACESYFASSQWRARSYSQLIVAGGEEAKQAIRDLTRWLKDAQVVAICDPYIFHFEPPKKKLREPIFRSEDDYVDFIAGLVPATTRHVKLCGAGYTKKIKSALKRKLKEGRTLDIFDTFHIHDRYVIKNYSEGRMLGTSFGGFHNKIFTMLPLPPRGCATHSHLPALDRDRKLRSAAGILILMRIFMIGGTLLKAEAEKARRKQSEPRRSELANGGRLVLR